MDDDLKHLRQRVSFSGVRQEDQRTSSRRGPMMSNGAAEEDDAAYAATVAAVAYAIAAREEEKKLLASQQRPPPAASMDEPAARTMPQSSKSPRTPKRGESLKKKPVFEGIRSSSSRWFTGKEPVNDDYQDEQANVSVNRPLRPAQEKPAKGGAISDESPPAYTDYPPRIKKDPSFTRKAPEKRGSRRFEQDHGNQTTAPPISRWFSGKEPIDDDYQDEQANVSVNRPLRPAQKDPSFTRKPPEKRGSRRFEQDQGNQTTVPPPPTARPMDKTTSSSYPAAGRESGAATTTSAGGSMAFSSENEAMADAWEKEKLARIKKQYNETMQTIAEWEAEKKAKARRQKELKDESESERKRAKALEEYNEEMARINKVAAASRLTAEEKRRSAERKARDKAHTIRATGKLPGTCGCF